MKKVLEANGAPASPNLLSAAIEVDGLIFTSGQIHMNTEFKLVGSTMTEKAEKVMENLKCVLDGAGLNFENVIKATVYVIDMVQYKEFNDVYLKYFSEPMPAREVVCVKELPLGASVEVSLIAKR